MKKRKRTYRKAESIRVFKLSRYIKVWKIEIIKVGYIENIKVGKFKTKFSISTQLGKKKVPTY